MAKTIVIGGSGNQAGASDTNGGAYEGAITWSTFQGTNGAALDSAVGASVTNNGGGFLRITSAGDFTNSLVDVYVYCDFAATYTDGRYLITAVDGSGNYIDINLAYSADTTANVSVGGAIATIEEGVGEAADADDILISGGPYNTLDSSSNILTSAFSASGATVTDRYANTLNIYGVDNTGVVDYDNPIELDGATNGATYGIQTTITNAHIKFHNFEVYGCNSDGARTVDYVQFNRCIFRNNGGNGVFADDFVKFYGCQAYSNTSAGFNSDNDCQYVSCIAYSNTGIGITSDDRTIVMYSRVYNNGGTYDIDINTGQVQFNQVYNTGSSKTLIHIATAPINLFYAIIGNVVDGRSGASNIGIHVSDDTTALDLPYVMNNVIINCATGLLHDTNLGNNDIVLNNSFFNNTSNVSGNITTGENPITSNPLLNDPTNGDYTLQNASSPLIDVGYDWGYVTSDTKLIAIGYYNANSSSGTSGGRRPRGRYQGI